MENIAIIMGGTSKENKISLKSADTIYNIKALYTSYPDMIREFSHAE